MNITQGASNGNSTCLISKNILGSIPSPAPIYYWRFFMDCLNCGEYTDNPKFCSRNCSAIFNNKLYPKRINNNKFKCMWCGVDIKRDNACCSRECRKLYNIYSYINKWMLHLENGMRGKSSVSTNVKYFLYNIYNNSCQKCNWGIIHPNTGIVPLDIHHIDGNCLNSYYENLELLCPNCHHLTDNYGSRNNENIISSKERLGYI